MTPEKQLSPMMELIEWIDSVIKLLPEKAKGSIGQANVIKSKATELLEKEESVIKKSYNDGQIDFIQNNIPSLPQNYYNETFKNPELLK